RDPARDQRHDASDEVANQREIPRFTARDHFTRIHPWASRPFADCSAIDASFDETYTQLPEARTRHAPGTDLGPERDQYGGSSASSPCFRLIAEGGLSNAETGREFFISDTTVMTQITQILMKFNHRDRVQVVVLASDERALFDH